MKDLLLLQGEYYLLVTRYINKNLYTVEVYQSNSKGEIVNIGYINKYEADSYRDARNYVKVFKLKWEV